jgi:hypothetical protein
MTFPDRIVVREIDVRALVRMFLDDFEALVRERAFLSILKIIWLHNNKLWFTKHHFSNLDDENFEKVKINK